MKGERLKSTSSSPKSPANTSGGKQKATSQQFSDNRAEATVQRKIVDSIQRMPEEEELMQGKFAKASEGQSIQRMTEEEELMQGKFAYTAKGTAIQRKTPNNGMPPNVQAKMENTLGSDFSNVQIHANSPKAPAVGALAYTQGEQVHFAPGQFKPDTKSGQELIGHELAHVVQQRKGIVKPTTEAFGMPINDSPKLENEADRLGKKAANS